MRTRRRWAAAALGMSLLLGACGAEDAAEEPDVAASEGAAFDLPAVAQGEDSDGTNADEAPAVAPASGTDLAALAGRDVIRTATMVIAADDVDAVVAEIERLTFVAGGFLGSVDRRGGDDPSATLVLRVPSGEFASSMTDLRGLGTVVTEQQQADDVTDQMVDVAARIGVAEASIERVRALLDQATAVPDVVSLEAELSRRVAELESLKGRQRVLADQTSLSTITVTVRSSSDAVVATVDDASLGFLAGLDVGWTVLVEVTRVAATITGALLPFVLVLAALVAPVWLWRRRRTAATA